MAKTVKVDVLLRLATLSGLSWWLSGKKKKNLPVNAGKYEFDFWV